MIGRIDIQERVGETGGETVGWRVKTDFFQSTLRTIRILVIHMRGGGAGLGVEARKTSFFEGCKRTYSTVLHCT
jgi:hypothetical protein